MITEPSPGQLVLNLHIVLHGLQTHLMVMTLTLIMGQLTV